MNTPEMKRVRLAIVRLEKTMALVEMQDDPEHDPQALKHLKLEVAVLIMATEADDPEGFKRQLLMESPSFATRMILVKQGYTLDDIRAVATELLGPLEGEPHGKD